MRVDFTKMNGLGNDFVIIDNRAHNIALNSAQITKLADRKFGIGCDQLIMVQTPELGDLRMDIYNADGSVAEACGNATRCVAKLFNANTIETVAGTLTANIVGDEVAVNMGQASILKSNVDYGLGLPNASFVTIGNPHIVLYSTDLNGLDIMTLGKAVQAQEMANINFAQVINKSLVSLKVYERGSGYTGACGTGACATVFAGIANGLLDAKVTVTQAHGDLQITLQDDGNITMQGDANINYTGVVEV